MCRGYKGCKGCGGVRGMKGVQEGCLGVMWGVQEGCVGVMWGGYSEIGVGRGVTQVVGRERKRQLKEEFHCLW